MHIKTWPLNKLPLQSRFMTVIIMKRIIWRKLRYVWFYVCLLSTSSLVYMFAKGVSQCPETLDNGYLPYNLQIPRYDHLGGNNSDKGEHFPLLTLFTTWGPKDNKHKVRKNVLKNWALLKPYARPVFLYSNGTNLKTMKDHGWDVLPISKSAIGLPILKFMYLDVMSKYESTFYGYSNGDILFDRGLVETLIAVSKASLLPSKPVIVTGRRTNVPITCISEDIGHDALSNLAKNNGSLFVMKAEDYFITDGTYPWQDVPELVIGRPAFDNWLILDSCRQGINVIEATPTVLAVHQTTEAGNFEGTHKKQRHYNDILLHKLHQKFRFSSGSTSCAPWMTKSVSESCKQQLSILWRNVPEFCYQY